MPPKLSSAMSVILSDRKAAIEQASRPARIVQAIMDQMPQVPEPRDPPTVTADGGDIHIHLHFNMSADDE